ncbi:MAG: hypothetical protein HKN57_01715 [Xanthomonadales bacterium]|nr:hypothetical protein [Gammaproteobacteria bacterium]MBT8052427.1 hypothetical protein [Gammaproteobacteria bacterium]NND55944.1 hypothetical protein [Xanthomonadales bacterium]NNK50529.1 hypothetical protein [Xanthomonadales bacterium]
MAGPDNSKFLRLVVDEEKEQAKKITTAWLMESAPDPFPDDFELLSRLEGYPGELGRKDLRELIEHLVAGDRLEKIQIGARQYLTRQKQPLIQRDDDRELFRLDIALDLEREKHLLYKIVIIIECIVIALIFRQWVLDPDFMLRFLN